MCEQYKDSARRQKADADVAHTSDWNESGEEDSREWQPIVSERMVRTGRQNRFDSSPILKVLNSTAATCRATTMLR